MRVFLLSVALTGLLLSPAYAQDEAKIADEFRVFAKKEVERLREYWKEREGDYVGKPMVGMGMPFTSNAYFFGITLESIPESYGIDVRKTNSIISPYVGVVEFPLVYLNTYIKTKGKKKFCNEKSLEVCLKAGARIVEKTAGRMPNTLEYEYVYRGGKWEAKISFEDALAAQVAASNVLVPPTVAIPAEP